MHNEWCSGWQIEFQCNSNLSLSPACGDLTGSNRIEKGKAVYLLDLFEGRLEKEVFPIGDLEYVALQKELVIAHREL